MPDDAAPVGPAHAPPTSGLPDFPADTRMLALSARDFAAGGEHTRRLMLSNPQPDVLHVRLSSPCPWLSIVPSEIALGADEKQVALVRVDTAAAQKAVVAGAPPTASLELTFQWLRPGQQGAPPSPTNTATVYVRLPLATCPACHQTLDTDPSDGVTTPEMCPFCFERLRPCPVCGVPNSWLARRCILDTNHVVRAAPDWPVVGGDPAHTGAREQRTNPSLSRRWSFPSVPPSSREAALAWSAPVAAYGLVTAAAAGFQGDAAVYAFETTKGTPLWEPYPLPDPVYPERGGAAIAGGRIFAATVEGVCVCVDALRGTRVWETSLEGRVYGAVVPVGDDGPLLVPVATSDQRGCLCVLDAATGHVRYRVPLAGPPDSAPAAYEELAFVHADPGTLTAVEWARGRVLWTADCGAGFDAAPVVAAGSVFSATTAGEIFRHDARTGGEAWRLAVTSAPFAGMPACDGTLLYAPADDGVHLVSLAGRAVRRFGLRRPVRSAPIISGGGLFFAGTDGNVYGVDAGRSLATLYESGVGSQVVAAPAFADGALYVAATNGVLYALTVAA